MASGGRAGTRVAIGLALAVAVLGGVAAAWNALRPAGQPPDPQAVAVHIERTPAQPWPGYGIYLGDGLVVTAAHVVGVAAQTKPRVVVAGLRLAAEALREGRYPEQDLTVLKIVDAVPPGLAGLRTAICSRSTTPGQAVLVATPERVTTSTMVSPEVMPPDLRDRYAASSIADVYTTGNSGSGVFDAERRCLLGIMSSKFENHVPTIVDGVAQTRTVGIAKHFVPAADIRAFLAGLPAP